MQTTRLVQTAFAGYLLSIAPSFLYDATAAGADETVAKKTVAEQTVLLSMPEPPEGYTVTKRPVEADGKPVGYRILVLPEGAGSNVVITVETSIDRSTKPARIAATKGYINGLFEALRAGGFNRVKDAIPDLEQTNFAETLQADATFANSAGVTLHTRQLIFFTKHGFSIQIASKEMQDVESLTQWAKHVRPAVSAADSLKP